MTFSDLSAPPLPGNPIMAFMPRPVNAPAPRKRPGRSPGKSGARRPRQQAGTPESTGPSVGRIQRLLITLYQTLLVDPVGRPVAPS